MIFPLAEITDMTATFNISCPTYFAARLPWAGSEFSSKRLESCRKEKYSMTLLSEPLSFAMINPLRLTLAQWLTPWIPFQSSMNWYLRNATKSGVMIFCMTSPIPSTSDQTAASTPADGHCCGDKTWIWNLTLTVRSSLNFHNSTPTTSLPSNRIPVILVSIFVRLIIDIFLTLGY